MSPVRSQRACITRRSFAVVLLAAATGIAAAPTTAPRATFAQKRAAFAEDWPHRLEIQRQVWAGYRQAMKPVPRMDAPAAQESESTPARIGDSLTFRLPGPLAVNPIAESSGLPRSLEVRDDRGGIRARISISHGRMGPLAIDQAGLEKLTLPLDPEGAQAREFLSRFQSDVDLAKWAAARSDADLKDEYSTEQWMTLQALNEAHGHSYPWRFWTERDGLTFFVGCGSREMRVDGVLRPVGYALLDVYGREGQALGRLVIGLEAQDAKEPADRLVAIAEAWAKSVVATTAVESLPAPTTKPSP